ncbi:MAG: phosphonoacetaldehyde hydrolase [Chloroflexi bacterium]|nr:phosphonoacetaldehyde hydrolase [Chloroflexota bacterium]
MSKPYSGPLKAVILDWAGTTVDYGCFAPVAVFINVFKRQGVEISIAQARAPMGLEKRAHIRAITQQPEVSAAWERAHQRVPNEDDIDKMYQDSVTVQKAVVADYAELIAGTLRVVTECRKRGLKIGSTTGYSQSIMEVLVAAAAAQGYSPDAVVCPSDVPAGRPCPYMIYQNAIQMNVYPMAAVVKVGDTVPDIEEGLNAGTWVVSVTQSGNSLGLSAADVAALSEDELSAYLAPIERQMRAAGAHYVIGSIADLPPVLEDIEKRLHSGEQP